MKILVVLCVILICAGCWFRSHILEQQPIPVLDAGEVLKISIGTGLTLMLILPALFGALWVILRILFPPEKKDDYTNREE